MVTKNGASVLKKVVTLSDLATLAVMSERSIQRLTKSGVIQQAKDRQGRFIHGRYVLGDCVSRLFEYTRDQATRDDPHERLYKQARARRMQATAQSEELRVKLQRGELLEREHVTREVTSLLLTVRAHLLALPSRITRQLLPHVANENENANFQSIYAITNGEVRTALTEASQVCVTEVFSLSPKQIAAAHRGASVEELAEMQPKRNGDNEDADD